MSGWRALLAREEAAAGCPERRDSLAALHDGELSGAAARALRRHVELCPGCAAQLQEMAQLSRSLRNLPSVVAPPGMGLRLRVAASHHSVRDGRWAAGRLRLRHLIQALALPMAVGTCAALALFAALVDGSLPKNLHTGPDVTVGDYSPPRLMNAPGYDVGASVLVEAQVDASGRVYGYRILSGPANRDVIARLNNQLLLDVFQPATTSLGLPTAGDVVVSFGHVDVRG